MRLRAFIWDEEKQGRKEKGERERAMHFIRTDRET
jgi:hypothetical protein